ncbi:pyridine nucleotide-disulfide oxidoreductase [Gordoniibacillus kamchatkensis]|uniref:Pyridine nucleotide-disulfide oxidoreductase n=1 Tax=Gordoniibacillus kamchatkensis TaxID=1590651 RepID=A0ABR5ALW0_9BACL|nr:NAD(P)/FAD-dependent oxidoreductase [Paenibacillus sp. VKM B-2647]KIL41858.1 pyridine nucleotide-disulfide oxidoreductase [Paenibacillus sp. VKM B-2647]
MDSETYDAIVVGGGIAGLQASIQLGRYMHSVLVIDKGTGRSTLCRSYHNVLGYPDGVAGEELRAIGRRQAETYGVRFRVEEAVRADRLEGGRFRVGGSSGAEFEADVLLIATGVTDRLPDVPGLKPCLGRTVYICPDCDGYEVRGKRTVVLGSGKAGAGMALALRYFTDKLALVNHAFLGRPAEAIPEQLERRLQADGIEVMTGSIAEVLVQGDGLFAGVRLSDGREIAGERAFTGFGGNEVNTELFRQLGAERMESKHVIADPRTKMTSVPGLFAAGDVGVHSEQLTIAMGEGQQAAIWMHKSLLQRRQAAKDNRQPAGKR